MFLASEEEIQSKFKTLNSLSEILLTLMFGIKIPAYGFFIDKNELIADRSIVFSKSGTINKSEANHSSLVIRM
jgi:hypothetical protein